MKVMYPGTFDPITNGHQDIIARMTKLFPEVLIAVAAANSKQTLFSVEERVEMLKHVVADMYSVTVLPFSNLTVDFARQMQVGAIVRGLRALSDFDFEFQLASCNHVLDPEIETIFMPTSAKEACVSATLVREIACLGGDISGFVDPYVAKCLRQKVAVVKH